MEAAEQIKHAELEVEKHVLCAVPDTRSTIHTLRSEGVSICFVSDMYLSASFIKERLIEHDIWRSSDRIHVSHKHGDFKHRGRLFRHVVDELPNGSRIVVHVGDSLSADVKGAQAAGLSSYHFDECIPNRYESILGRYIHKTNGVSGLLAGASRAVRLHEEPQTEHEAALSSVAAGVLAPAVVGFVAWVLRQAKRRKLDRLYFSARDGYLFLPVAHALVSAFNMDCEMRYLYLSRAAITAPYPRPEVVSSTWDYYEQAHNHELLARLHLTAEDIAPFLSTEEEHAYATSSPATEQSKQAIQSVLSQMITNECYPDALAKNQRQLLDYLQQEKWGDAGRSGFVDIGWRGSIHRLLNDLLLEADMISEPVPGFYFGLNSNQHEYANYRTAYFFDKHRKIGHEDPLPEDDISTVMEMFCTASHGTVTGFRSDGKGVSPILEPT